MCMVSVVIPYFNRQDTLLRALESVRNQTYNNFEIILVNDGSTDQSEEIVNIYIDNHPNIRFKHISQTNSGPSGARNSGIRSAEGKYIAFLDSDDAWEPLKLKTQIDYMEKHPDIAITGTNCYISKESKWHKYCLNPSVVEASFYRMLFKVVFITPTVVIRKEIFLDQNIWFQPGKNQAEDLLLFLQIVRKNRGVRLSTPLASLFKLEYGEDNSLTSDLSKLLTNELDNLKILYAENHSNPENKISGWLRFVLIGYSYLKHFKRVLRVKWMAWKALKNVRVSK